MPALLAGPGECSAGTFSLPQLHTLDLSDNRFQELPADLPQSVIVLDVSQNNVCSTPTWLSSRCMRLAALFLHANGINILDSALLQLPDLQLLSLHDNPLCDGTSQLALALSTSDSAATIKQALGRSSNRADNSRGGSSPAPDV